MSFHFNAIKIKQRKVQMYLAAVPVNYLDHFVVDIWEPKNVAKRKGYQRKPDETRTKKIAKYFEHDDAIMPVAGLLNVREKSRLKYKNGKLSIPDGTKVWVVDMQHRLKGLVRAFKQKTIKADFIMPVVVTEGLSQVEEAVQFYIINTKAKKMDVALTRRLLIENDSIKDIADVNPWEITAVQITIDLNKSIRNNPWYGAIREPNEEKQSIHVATEKSFVSSLRQLLITGKFKQPHKIAKKLAKFWSAVRENIPEAFEEPNRYLIQKTSGIFAFNFFIAPTFINKYKEKDFVKRLQGLKDLGSDFWIRSDKKGSKRFGTGMGGYSNLSDYIKTYL